MSGSRAYCGFFARLPHAWVTKAQRIPLDPSLQDRPRGAETWLTSGDLEQLERELEIDPMFGSVSTPILSPAAEAAGMHELALGLEREIREPAALAERIGASDGAYRARLDADPLSALGAAGIPVATAEPLLQALTVPDDARKAARRRSATRYGSRPPRARLLNLLVRASGSPRRSARPRAARSRLVSHHCARAA